jgi:hypothetical protein
MLKQTINFTDYNGEPRSIVEYFHLNEAEIVDMQAKSPNGLEAEMQDAILSNDAGRVLDFIKNLVHLSYGKKSADGLNFDKSPEILHRFITSAYYSDFLLGLIEDNGRKGQEFVTGIMPAKLVERAMAQVQGQNAGQPDRTVYEPSARERFAAAQAAQAGSTDANTANPIANAFGQPQYPQFQQPAQPEIVVQENPVAPQGNEDWQAFQQWKAQQTASQATQTASAPASPDAFRVREPEPSQGLPRPPHEQVGDVQQ